MVNYITLSGVLKALFLIFTIAPYLRDLLIVHSSPYFRFETICNNQILIAYLVCSLKWEDMISSFWPVLLRLKRAFCRLWLKESSYPWLRGTSLLLKKQDLEMISLLLELLIFIMARLIFYSFLCRLLCFENVLGLLSFPRLKLFMWH